MAQIKSKTRLIFLIFNILYFSMGVGMFGVGLYNIFSLQGFEEFGESAYITGGVLFAILGIAKILLAILGIISMLLEWKIPLAIYFIMAGGVVMFFTLAAGIFGLQQWYFVFDDVGVNMKAVYNDSVLFNQTTTLREEFRLNFNCCGISTGPDDYVPPATEPGPFPNCSSAMTIREGARDQPQQIGCQYYITAAIRFHLYYIGTIGLAFGFFDLTAALVAMQHMEGL